MLSNTQKAKNWIHTHLNTGMHVSDLVDNLKNMGMVFYDMEGIVNIMLLPKLWYH